MARKEELKELRARQKRALIVDFDFEKAAVFEVSLKEQLVKWFVASLSHHSDSDSSPRWKNTLQFVRW